MSRLALAALLGLGALTGCVPYQSAGYGYGYGAAPAPVATPYYDGGYAQPGYGGYGGYGGYAPYYAPAVEPTIIIGGEREDYRRERYREEGRRDGREYRREAPDFRREAPRVDRGDRGRDTPRPAFPGMAPVFARPSSPPAPEIRLQPNPSRQPGAIQQERSTVPDGGRG